MVADRFAKVRGFETENLSCHETGDPGHAVEGFDCANNVISAECVASITLIANIEGCAIISTEDVRPYGPTVKVIERAT